MKQIFSKVRTLDDALFLLLDTLRNLHITPSLPERVLTTEAVGRITAAAVFARYSSPFYHSAAMDGYAVRFSSTLRASEREPLHLKIGTDAVYLDTGDPMPQGFDSLIMIEDVNIKGELLEIYQPVPPYQHVRVIGEDIVATELIIPENHKIRHIDMAAMTASGILDVEVRKRPVVSIIPTGTEIITPESIRYRQPEPPEIIEYNSVFLSGLLQEAGAEVYCRGIVRDHMVELKNALLRETSSSDISILIAGSGRGSEDYTARVIEETGSLIIQGVAIKPGKPFIAGIVNNKPVIGIPGYPVSAYVCLNLFVMPIISMYLGGYSVQRQRIRAVISRQLPSQLGVDEFVRMKTGSVEGRIIATPVGRGAGLMMSLVRADGMLKIPSDSEGYNAGTEVEVELIRPMEDVHNTIVCIGSHDNSIDILANFLKRRYPAYSLSSAHVGSMGGLTALKRGEAHMAGCHLLDEQTGEYNIPFLKKMGLDTEIVLINLLYREQGLLVLKGNPKGIRGFEDLQRQEVVYVNRQAGSGTRLLLDKHLRECNIDPESVNGYNREEFTHMSVASAILTGVADTGLAVCSAAQALGLDFIPVASERYDIAIPSRFLQLDSIRALINIVTNDKEFRETVVSLGGYDVRDMGKVIYTSHTEGGSL